MGKKGQDVPKVIEQAPEEKNLRMKYLANENFFNEADYRFDDSFKPGDPTHFQSVHTVAEMMSCLEKNADIDIDAILVEANSKGQYRYRKYSGKKAVQEAWKSNARLKKFREVDSFAGDSPSNAGTNAGLVGDDYVPLLGGPFNKQPYLYDYLRAHAYCFQEYNHHPLARAVVHITRDFVLGRGYRIDSDDPKALAMWRAFEEANHFEEMIEAIVKEGSTFGENMIWWLPNQETYISYQDAPGQEPKKGIIPRIRLIDPSTCWEIVTYPEDITRVLTYNLVFPTQYQMYTGRDAGAPVPTSKFIMQQLPAQDVMHFKYNCMSNEKRGRSDLFPVLGYLKWVKDCVNYKLISLKKQAAWTEDIVVEGSQTDVDNVTASLAALGTFEPAGSRFVHTDKIKREYLATKEGSSGKDDTLDWGLNMVAAGVQIPVTYFGLSHSSGQTKASAIVGTEPVAKKFERRQQEVRRIIKAIWRKFQDKWGVPGSECEVTFPEIITQDRSAKLKDIKFVEDCGYIARATAAPLAAKELDVDSYDYDEEKAKIDAESPAPITPNIITPLTAPPAAPGASPASGAPPKPEQTSAVTSDQKKSLSDQERKL